MATSLESVLHETYGDVCSLNVRSSGWFRIDDFKGDEQHDFCFIRVRIRGDDFEMMLFSDHPTVLGKEKVELDEAVITDDTPRYTIRETGTIQNTVFLEFLADVIRVDEENEIRNPKTDWIRDQTADSLDAFIYKVRRTQRGRS